MVFVIDAQIAGVSGDMLLCSLVNIGANRSKIIDGISNAERFCKGVKVKNIDFIEVKKKSLQATELLLEVDDDTRERKGIEMKEIIEKSLEKYGMMWNLDKKTRMDRTEELLTAFNLVEIRKKRNEDLSIGQRRRVQVAREFMHDMDLLFLDEPTVGLDPTARRQLLDFLKNKVKEKNLTIFYTTHVLTEAEYLCDNIAIINKGRIITVDSPNELKKRFGREKTIKIHVSSNTETLGSLLENIQDCKIEFNTGATITIHSTDSELVLMNILKILNQNNIAIDDLSAIPINLEEIFLKVVGDSNASDNQIS